MGSWSKLKEQGGNTKRKKTAKDSLCDMWISVLMPKLAKYDPAAISFDTILNEKLWRLYEIASKN